MSAPRSSKLIGRSGQMQLLRKLGADLASEGFACVVTGGAGVGKTRLVSEYLREARRFIPHVLCTRIQEGGIGSADALAESARDLLELNPRLKDAQLLRRLAPLLDSTTGAAETIAVQSAYAQLLRRASMEGPLLLVVEDAHWADRGTLLFLCNIAYEISNARVGVLLTMRSGEELFDALAGMVVQRLAKLDRFSEVVLRPLNSRESVALIRSLSRAGGAIAPADARRIGTLSQGVPFYVHELMRWYYAHGAKFNGLPSSLNLLLHESLGDLSEDQRSLLRAASVLGASFSSEDLQRITGASQSRVLDAVRAFVASRLVQEEEASRAFSFAHALLREAAYTELISEDRKALHARVVELLQARSASFAVSEMLAYHSYAAGLAEQARTYNEAFGDEALQRSHTVLATIAYKRAMEYASGGADYVRLRKKLASAYREAGDVDGSLTLYRQALDESSDPEERVQLLREYGLTARYAMQNTLAQSAFDEAYALAQAQGNAAAAAGVARMRTGIELERPDADRAEHFLVPPSPNASPAELCRYESLRAAIAAIRGDVAAAREASERSIALAESDETGQLAAYAHGAAGMVFTFLGLAGAAIRQQRAALDILHETDAVGVDVMTRLRLAYALFLAGHLEEAHAVVTESPAPGDLAIARVSELTAALPVAALRGDDELARRCHDEAIVEAAFGSGELTRVGPLLLGVTLYGERTGQTDRLSSLFDRAVMLSNSAYGSEPALAFAALYGSTKTQEKCERMLAAARSPAGLACHALFRAYMAQDTPDRKRAAEEAADRFTQLPWPYFAARALELAEQREAAAEIYRRIGARTDEARIFGTSRSDGLSKRERQIAEFAVKGKTSREIADELSLSARTVENHLGSIYRKLRVRTRTELASRLLGSQAK